MSKALVIVESPAKAKTINKILGSKFMVKACMGHIRDLPKGQFGVDIEHGFQPDYRIIPAKKKILAEIQESLKKADALYLAPDPDREGEAIAWHLLKALRIPEPGEAVAAGKPAEKPAEPPAEPPPAETVDGKPAKRKRRRKKAEDEPPPSVQVFRVTFNEITKKAVLDAFQHPSQIAMEKVHAQQARRLLDRIVGYKISPLLWKKVGKGLSAGRVQSVAVRLVVEREKEIAAFKPDEYWSIGVTLATPEGGTFLAELKKRDGQEVAIPNEAAAKALVAGLEASAYTLTGVSSKERSETPPPPFTTSLLQQQASIKLGFSTKKTMMIAQQLYEGLEIGEEGAVGLITYMRTDSFRIADEALAECRTYIPQTFGEPYLEPSPRVFATKASAQGAHEAVRPTSVSRTPEALRPHLTDDQFRLYRLIWKRFVATQMAPSRFRVTDASIEAAAPGGTRYALQAKGRELLFDGFTKVAGQKLRKDEQLLPPMKEGAPLQPKAFAPVQHFTQPPPRYSEASLVKALEKHGIGRPSTYAPIISTIQERGYVRQEMRKLYATELGTLVTEKLVAHFGDILNTGFTSQMETQLDKIEESETKWEDVLRNFHGAFEKDLERAATTMESAGGIPPESHELCVKCNAPMVIRWNQSGKFLGCSAFPACKNTKSLGSPEAGGVVCEKCGKPLVVKTGRFGRFLACSGYPDCKNTRPFSTRTRKVNIPPDFKLDCEKCGKPIVVKYGRRGGFLACSGYPDCRNTKPFPKEWYPKKEDQPKPPEDVQETAEEAETNGSEDES